MRLLTKISAAFDRLLDLLALLAGIIIILVMLGVSSEVITRYFLNNPIPGVIDIAEVSILWITFLCAARLLRKGGHVRMDTVIDRLPTGGQATLRIITSIIGAVIFLILSWYSAHVSLEALKNGTREYGVLSIPTAAVLIVIPIGSILLFIQCLRQAYGYWRESKIE